MNEEEFPNTYLALDPVGLKTLLYAVNEAIRVWPGGDKTQQEILEQLKMTLTAADLDNTYHHL